MTQLQTKLKGFALISTLIFLVITISLISVAMTLSVTNRKLSADNVKTIQAQLAAEAGLERIAYEIWQKTLGTNLAQKPANFEPNLQYYQNLLGNYSGKDAITGSNTLMTNGKSLRFEDSFANGASFDATVKRIDAGDSIHFEVISTGNYQGATRRISQRFAVQGNLFRGSLFALLTNNVNCIFCHAEVTSIEAAYKSNGSLANLSSDGTLAGTERVRVGVLEDLTLDKDGGDSLVTGTIYTRGSSSLKSSSKIKTVQYENDSGILKNTITSFAPQNCSLSTCTAFGNTYSNYPISDYPDGELPNDFPMPIPDINGNKQIDNAEWTQQLSTDASAGSLSGGSIKFVDTTVTETVVDGKLSQTVSPDPLRIRQNRASLSSMEHASRGVPGNVILDGSINPLKIEGTLYVDGDVVIKGAITGNGKIVARGNVYVVGDIKYACGQPAQISNCNYGNPETLPSFGLVAGGNVLLGPYMNRSTKDSLTLTADASADKAIFDDGLTGDTSFTSGEAALFNYKEYVKAQADPSYIPRFYRLRAEAPIWRCKDLSCRKPSYTQLLSIDATTDASIMARAHVVDLSPTANWLAPADSTDSRDSEREIKGIWANTIETGRPSGALQLDTLLYSSNAIFTIAPKNSKIQGEIIMNGSLIAADTGVLTPGSLRIHYDQRLSNLLDLRSQTNLTLLRSSFQYCTATEANCGGTN